VVFFVVGYKNLAKVLRSLQEKKTAKNQKLSNKRKEKKPR
jgi:hypothetical protein